MPVHETDHRLVLSHAKGSSAEILFYGATIISWKVGTRSNSDAIERLFVSSKAALDGTKPVRGGIPIVFPCFGRPSRHEHSRLSQHGFARNQVWTFDGVTRDDETGVSVRLRLDPTASVKAVYDREFELVYVVTLEEHELSTELQVTNTSAEADELEFQALLHNYIRAPADRALVSPLENKMYYDKTEETEEGRSTAKTETRTGVDVREFTDSVYEDAGERYEVRWPGECIEIRVSGFKDLVLWNPQETAGSKIGDMESLGWERFVCVEPGYVRGFVRLSGGRSWHASQVLTVV